MKPRHKSASTTAPTFLWQGFLILLPVFVLASVGLFFLRQDRRLVEAEAKSRAQQLADEIAQQIHRTLASNAAPDIPRFSVDESGSLIRPPPFEPIPQPRPFDLNRLSPRQHELWQSAQMREFQGRHSNAIADYQQLLLSSPPEEFSAAAAYATALLLFKSGHAKAAFEHLITLTNPAVILESGLPVRTLVESKVIEIAIDQPGFVVNLDGFCSNAVHQPTALTPQILERSAALADTGIAESRTIRQWHTMWQNDQTARMLYQKCKLRVLNSLPIWTTAAETNWLLYPTAPRPAAGRVASDYTPLEFVCYSLDQLRRAAAATIADRLDWPPYFGIEIEIAQRALSAHVASPANRAGQTPGALAPIMATSRNSEHTAPQVHAIIRLIDPAALYQHQRTRSIWFAVLILTAAAAAFAGWFAAWRAFHRQQRLHELKGNFISSVSHELRAPIASVRLMAEGLAGGRVQDPHKQLTYFRFIVDECKRLSALIENVLDFSRIEKGRKQYSFEPTDLPALVRATVELMRPYAADREVALNHTLNGEEQFLNLQPELDAPAIQQALVNLIDNAVKHSPPGAAVTIGLDQVQPSPEHSARMVDSADHPVLIRLWVQDQGRGIPPEEQTRIFERFYRLGSELRRETQGAGIGLSIVKHIAEAHGGRITVTSSPGHGSRFTIELDGGLPTKYTKHTKGIPDADPS